jgi:type I restriction enzyme S subunit
MRPERKTFRIEEIAEVMGDAPFGSSLKNDDYTESGALVVQGKNIQGRRSDWTDRRYVSSAKYGSLPRSHCFPGDLIFPKVGTIGKVGILTPCEGVSEYLLSTNTMRLRTDESKANRDYVYYFFSSTQVVNLILAINSKSVQPVFNFTTLKNFEIEIPPIAEQRAIGHILGRLDDKIELNRRINETLEAIARGIFKSWFVDFDPVRAKMEGREPGLPKDIADLFPDRFENSELGEIPGGWCIAALPEIIEINPPRLLKKGQVAPYLDMANMPTQGHSPDLVVERPFGSGMRFINGDTLVARITPCLENGKTALVDFLEDGQVGWGSTEYIVLRPKPLLPEEFAYCLARSDEFREFAIQSMTGTSGRQRVPPEALSHFLMIRPPNELAEIFGRTVKPLFTRAHTAAEESHTLAALREALLPKLLSGEICVKDLQNSVNVE